MNSILKRTLKIAGWLVLTVVVLLTVGIGYVWWKSPGETAPIEAKDGQKLPNSIATMEQVELNGVKQWIFIRGADRNKPVLLFLHGGPGSPELPLLVGSELEKRFVVVNWDQRGAGKSYSDDVFNNTFTVNTLVSDAAELSRILAKRFGQPKIYVMGHSWGSMLGVLTVKQHPELFHAYFGIGQVARQLEAEQVSYDWVLAQAKQRHASGDVEKLEAFGRPANQSPEVWIDYLGLHRRLVTEYGGAMYKGNFFKVFVNSLIGCREYTFSDKVNYLRGALTSASRLWPSVISIDLFKEAASIDVPVYIFQGRHDYQTAYVVARRYFDALQAPQKQFFTFEQSAHSPIFEEPEHFVQLVDTILAGTPAAHTSAPATPMVAQDVGSAR